MSATGRGFSTGKAVGGALLLGPLGLLGGLHGRNKVLVTCLACGHRWDPAALTAAAAATEAAPSSTTASSEEPVGYGCLVALLVLLAAGVGSWALLFNGCSKKADVTSPAGSASTAPVAAPSIDAGTALSSRRPAPRPAASH